MRRFSFRLESFIVDRERSGGMDGETNASNIEPLEGLMEGDQIVVAGQAGLKNGSLVSLPGDEDEASSDEDEEDDEEIVARASR